MRGIASTGLDVVDLGPVTTPMLYYVAATRGALGCSSGIQVTGSHNPKDYNGFKMVLAGRAIYGEEIQSLRKRIERSDYATGEGRIATMDIAAEYKSRITSDCRLERPMTIAVDCGTASPARRRPASFARWAARCTSSIRRWTATSRTTTRIRASPRTSPT
jgi:phosphomannomutase